MDQSAVRDEGALLLMCHTLIKLQMPWWWPYLWLILLLHFAGSSRNDLWILIFFFPSNNTTQKLSCCRFLCTVHYNTCCVRGGVSQKLTIRHNMYTKSWMWWYILFFTWIIVMLLLKLRLNEENKGLLNEIFIFLSLYFTYACFGMLVCYSLNFM